MRGARIAGGDVHALHVGILREAPGEGMFAATGADDEEFHFFII